jgi:S1-C subfamily serine protease
MALMPENRDAFEEEPVCTTWTHTVQAVLGVLLLIGASVLAYHYAPPPSNDLADQVQQLTIQVDQLKQEQAMPTMVLNRYRDSICYIYGVYQVGFPEQRPDLRARISGTGFVVAEGLLATNRHVAEPWYGDPEASDLIRKGARPRLEKLVAFFPGFPTPVDITPVALSTHGDLAVLRVENSLAVDQLRPLPLADLPSNPGELVAVIGYPMGVLGMVAKSPAAVYDRLAYRRDDIRAANELAALSLIRPSATCGHLGDVVGDKLIYDAPTAHGASGGPVFNSQGQVIGINAAFIDGFSGGTLGVSVQALRPLIEVAQKKNLQIPNSGLSNLSGTASPNPAPARVLPPTGADALP